jgi:hypothetical protein
MDPDPDSTDNEGQGGQEDSARPLPPQAPQPSSPAQEYPTPLAQGYRPPSDLRSPVQGRVSIVTGTDFHSRMTPMSSNSHTHGCPQPSGVRVTGKKAIKDPLRCVSFSFDEQEELRLSPSRRPLQPSQRSVFLIVILKIYIYS